MNSDSLKRNQRATHIVFVAVSLLMAMLVFLFLKQMYLDQEQGIRLAKHSYEVREQLLEIRNDLIQSATGQNIFLLTASHCYLQPSMFAESDTLVRLSDLSALLADRPPQLDRLNRLRHLIERILAENHGADSSKAPPREEKTPQTDQEWRDSFLADQIGGIIREMQEDEDSEKVTQSDVDARATVSTVLLCVTAAAIIGAGVLLLRIRQLQRIITVCAWTQRVNFNGKWMRMEDFLWRRFRVKVSHGISEQAFEGVMGMASKNITTSDNRADEFHIPSARPDVTPGS